MISFLDPTEIAHWGLKAASMKYFVEHGLHKRRHAFFDSFISKEDIIQKLRAAGFPEYSVSSNELGMSVRFSSRTESLYQLHRWAILSLKEVADFIELHQSMFQNGTFIVLETLVPLYQGNFFKRANGDYHLEIVPGTWVTSGIEPTDYAEINGSKIYFFAYQKHRRVCGELQHDERGEVIMGKFVPRVDPPLTEEVIKRLSEIAVKTSQRLTELNLPSLLYEFVLYYDFVPLFKEAKEIDEKLLLNSIKHSVDFYEIDDYEKIKFWDKKTPLYISVGVEKGDANKFQAFVSELRGKVTQVYIKYGMLTHPAIVLREAGIMPISLRSQYKMYQ